MAVALCVLSACRAAPAGTAIDWSAFDVELVEPEIPVTFVQPDADGVVPLPLGATLEDTLAAGQSRRYALPEGGEHLFRVAVDQRGIDVEVALLDDASTARVQVDSLNQNQGLELLEALTAPQGRSWVEVSALAGQVGTGSYRIRLESWEPATPAARQRAAALASIRQAVDACSRLLESIEDSTSDLWKPACSEALRLSAALGERRAQAAVFFVQGHTAVRTGRWQEAAEPLQRAFAMWSEPADVADRSWAVWMLAKTAREGGYEADPQPLLAQVAEFLRRRGDPRQEAMVLNDVAWTYTKRGDIPNGQRAFARAARLLWEAGDVVEYAVCQVNLGRYEVELGNYRAAQEHYDEARKFTAELAAHHVHVFLDLLIGEAALSLRFKEPEALLERLEVAKPYLEQIDDPVQEGQLRLNEGAAYLILGNQRAALDSIRRALELFEHGGGALWQAEAHCQLGAAYRQQPDLQAALTQYEVALALARQATDPAIHARALQGRGAVYRDMGQSQRALEDLDQAVELYRQAGLRHRQASALNDIADTYSALGQDEAAERSLRTALELNGGRDPILEAGSRFRLARYLRGAGRFEEALAELETVGQLDEDLRRGLTVTEFREAFGASRRLRLETMIDVLLALNRKDPKAGHAQRAFQASERARARSLSQLLAEARVDLRRSADAGLLQRMRELEREIGRLREETANRVSARDGDGATADRLARLRGERRLLENEIRTSSPKYASLTYPRPFGVEQARALLAPRTALVEYVVGEERCLVFLVTHGRFEVIHLPLTSDELRQRVGELRAALAGTRRSDTAAYQRAAVWLYERILRPVEPFLAQVDRLVIVPDRDLFYLPFEALLSAPPADTGDPASWRYLVQRFEVVYGPSATVLADLGCSLRPRATQWVAFADPEYGGRLPRLAASAEEARRIAALMPAGQARIYTGAAATETAVKGSAELFDSRWIHFAVHGSVDESETANIRLELASSPEDDGKLSLGEIFDLQLHAQVAVLSACQTALGREVSGEGLIGLSRGFFYAGACSVVVSLWRVEDLTTSDLMVRFYRGATQGEELVTALRAAKLATIEQGGLSAHPHYWAPFVLMGNPSEGVL